MARKKRPPNTVLRTISIFGPRNIEQLNILRFMAHEAKNIFNVSIFHTQIYFAFSNKIFEELYKLVLDDKISDIKKLDAKLSEIYDKYYKLYLSIKDYKSYNDEIIYNFIKKNLVNVDIINSNYYSIEKFIITSLEKMRVLKFPQQITMEIKNELFYSIVTNILKSFYNKNFVETKEAIFNRIECRIKDKLFIEQVKNNKHLFGINSNKNIFKPLLKKHSLFQKLTEKIINYFIIIRFIIFNR